MIELSIVIPVYNGAATIGRCLDSIYSQGLDTSLFEIICVDDCSPDSSIVTIEGYQYNSIHPQNLTLFKHAVNKRAGGARNTGLSAAKGKWVLFLDCDDFYFPDTLPKVISITQKNEDLDFIMFDLARGDGNKVFSQSGYSHFCQSVISGPEFLKRHAVPWEPWTYLFKKENLDNNHIRYVENVYFEDTDFVLHSIAMARKCCYVPLTLLHYVVSYSTQMSKIGSNITKIRDIMALTLRIYDLSKHLPIDDKDALKVIANHADHLRQSSLKRYVWRLPYKEIRRLFAEYKLSGPSYNRLVLFADSHPRCTAIILTMLKPVLSVAAMMKAIIKKHFLRP